MYMIESVVLQDNEKKKAAAACQISGKPFSQPPLRGHPQ
jgi:hypothetical protein